MRYISNQLAIEQGVIPSLTSNQVLVQVEAFGLNRADVLQRQGKYPPPPGESAILGLEVSGVVIKKGNTATKWQVGERVFGLVAGGGYATHVAVEENHLMPIPHSLDSKCAAGITEVFLTAYQALVSIMKIKPKQNVLIHAGASGVGLAAIQLAKHFQCQVACTVSNENKMLACKALGADLVINYKTHNFKDVLKEEWPQGADCIVDVIGGPYMADNLSVINLDGHIVSLAILGGRFAEKFDMAKLLAKRVTIHGTTLRNRSIEYKGALITSFSNDILPLFAKQEMKVPLDTIYPASQVSLAHSRLENNETIGKLVCYWEAI